MRLLSTRVIILFTFSSLLFSGCGGSGMPVTPDNELPPVLNQADNISAGGREILLGLYDIIIDRATGNVDIIPERGASFELNLLKFLQPPVKNPSLISLDFLPETNFWTGYILVDIGIEHPLPSTQFMIFDVMGIFFPAEGDSVSTVDPTIAWPSGDQAKLINADGYTRWWNQVEFTSFDTVFGYTEWHIAPHLFNSTTTLNPFKYYADGLAPDDPADPWHLMGTNRGSFSPSSPGFNERRYEIQFPYDGATVDYRFKFAISASFEFPNPGWTLPVQPDDFPLTGNRPEAVIVNIIDTGSSAYYYSPTNYGGDLSFELSFTDWQGGGTLTGTMGEFTGIYAESPTLFDGTFDLMETSEWSPPEPGDASFTMWCYLPDISPTTTSNQEILFTIKSTFPTDYSVQIPGFTGLDYPIDAELAAYQVWDVPVQSD